MTTADRLRAEGEARGELRGETKERIAILMDLMTTKFGPLPAQVRNTIYTATADEQHLWARRLLTATSLDEVFAE
ncbi:hypothetical protein [Nocardia goodfellowii]|uniref:DUF4351 domain-containing protein n=1 Tax=Nocardia goodfellowii TaxID=882446 RepID=A0ABS4QBZ6_9NOCA|nr:hypothetical protein [Nocardia goodfellowii]MBP2188660.1 hypothetical protein [Nocardia goodfellowii]